MTIKLAENYLYDEESKISQWWTKIDYTNWDSTNEDWMYETNDLPDIKSGLHLVDTNGEEWLILKGYPSWSEDKKIGDEKWHKPYKRLWYQIRSYLIRKKDLEIIKKWANQEKFSLYRLPDESSRYEIFSREFYWSPAYHYFSPEKNVENLWQEIENKNGELNIPPVILTAEYLNWEEENDYSKEYTIRIIKPSAYIFKKMDLDFGKKEGDFINKNGEVICFDPSVFNKSQSYLLIKKKPFLEFLKENELEVFWAVEGEKNVIGNDINLKKGFLGWLIMKEIYWFEDEKILESKKTDIG
ncbi:MAG TPA: hypothetical protein PKE69_02675 [Pyrinomonadaceae bacterium]|nr:hypothetical protein [Pyrinomonadaceae bacterium]